ncbi:MAG: ChaB family protein [Xanthobacteraceae bacterium]
MPYPTNADLPASVRAHLPEHAQDIYREAFNHAYAAHAGESRQEEAAHRIAWAAARGVQSRLCRACGGIPAGGSRAPDRLGGGETFLRQGR